MNTHDISCRYDAVFRHSYAVENPDMRRLYENAKRDQWNASRDIAWETPAPGDGFVADELIELYGTPIWDKLSPEERIDLNRRVTAWRLSALVYGEHGAMLVCSQLVETVSGADEKLFQATQVVDEGRHTEVLTRYIDERLKLTYPMPVAEKELFDTLLSGSSWPMKTIGLQLIAETFAVSLFRMLAETSKDDLLREICKRILQDESRHMGFGMLALPDVVAGLTAGERAELEEFTGWAIVNVLTGLRPDEVYREMGLRDGDIREARRARQERGGEAAFFRRTFRKDLHGSILSNLRKIGLLGERVTSALASAGVAVPAAPQ